LKDRKRETSEATFAIYQKTTQRFLCFLGTDALRELGNATKSRITDYRNQLADKLAPATVNRDVKIIRMIFRQARLDGYLFRDPAEGVQIVKSRSNGEKPRRPLTIPEIQAILSVADPEWQSLIKFGLYTGQRLADIASLSWDQIDLEARAARPGASEWIFPFTLYATARFPFSKMPAFPMRSSWSLSGTIRRRCRRGTPLLVRNH
jgi:integrase